MYTQLCSYAQVIRRAIGKLCVNGANAGASERASERPGPVVCQPPLTFRIPKQWPISPLILTFARFLGVRLGSRADVVDFTPGGGGDFKSRARQSRTSRRKFREAGRMRNRETCSLFSIWEYDVFLFPLFRKSRFSMQVREISSRGLLGIINSSRIKSMAFRNLEREQTISLHVSRDWNNQQDFNTWTWDKRRHANRRELTSFHHSRRAELMILLTVFHAYMYARIKTKRYETHLRCIKIHISLILEKKKYIYISNAI